MFIYVENRFNPRPRITRLPDATPVPGRVLVPFIDAPFLAVPRDEDGLRALRRGTFWRKRGAEARKFENAFGPLEFRVLRRAEELETWLPKVHELFLRRWAGRHTGSEWRTAEGFAPFANAMIALAADEEASLSVLRLRDEEKLLAFSYNLERERTLHFYQHASDPDERYRASSLGTQFLIRMLGDVVESGRFDLFDFMIGTQSYKLDWASGVQRTWQIVSREDHGSAIAWRGAVLKRRGVEAVRNNGALYSALKRGLSAVESRRHRGG